MKFLSRGLCAAALLSAALATPAQAAPNVTIRIEGEQRTLLERTTVTLDPAQVPGVSDECPGDTIAGAIDKGTGGNWDKQSFVKEILDETHQFERNDSWAGWLGGNVADLSGGFCSAKVQEGDEVIVQANFYDPNTFDLVFRPSFLRDVPRQVERGVPFTVRVEEIVPGRDQNGYEAPDTGEYRPVSGTTVSAGSAASGTTDGDGRVTLRIDEAGEFTLQASKGGGADRSQPVAITVLEPGVPAPPPPPAPPAPPCATNGADGRCGTFDSQAPTALIRSIDEGARFRRGRGPRELSGTVGVLGADRLLPDASGIAIVKLRLTRTAGGRCSTYSPTRERFVRRPCGAANGFWFGIGTAPDWEYVLPARLPRGRYVLDADAIDRSGNRLRERRRGENRVVFRVR